MVGAVVQRLRVESWAEKQTFLSLKPYSAKGEASRVWGFFLDKILNQLKILFCDVERKSLPFQRFSFLLNVSSLKIKT